MVATCSKALRAPAQKQPLFAILLSNNMSLYSNSLKVLKASNQLCKAFGIKVSPSTHIVELARNGGFDSLFIDLEHAWLSLDQAATLCHVGLLTGMTPFVRVPHQCGNGFIQRVLDGGAMGIIFPHIHCAGWSSCYVAGFDQVNKQASILKKLT